MIEFGQLRLPTIGRRLDVRGLDVGLTVEVSILAAQNPAVAGSLDAIAGAADRHTGIGF